MNRYRKLNKLRDSNTRKEYYKRAKYPTIKLSTSDIYIITGAEERLDNLAYQYYRNSNLWWIISLANPNIIRRDSYYIKPGLQIRIPADKDGILEDFERINQ